MIAWHGVVGGVVYQQSPYGHHERSRMDVHQAGKLVEQQAEFCGQERSKQPCSIPGTAP